MTYFTSINYFLLALFLPITLCLEVEMSGKTIELDDPQHISKAFLKDNSQQRQNAMNLTFLKHINLQEQPNLPYKEMYPKDWENVFKVYPTINIEEIISSRKEIDDLVNFKGIQIENVTFKQPDFMNSDYSARHTVAMIRAFVILIFAFILFVKYIFKLCQKCCNSYYPMYHPINQNPPLIV